MTYFVISGIMVKMTSRKNKQDATAAIDFTEKAIQGAENMTLGSRSKEPSGNPLNTLGTGEGQDALQLIQMVRAGLDYPLFERFSAEAPFTPAEWAGYLHLSERTIQRYKKEQSAFEPYQTERILEIILLFNLGEKVFGKKEKFNAWLNGDSPALGHVKPKELLDSSFGINLLKDELIKIEHGVLA